MTMTGEIDETEPLPDPADKVRGRIEFLRHFYGSNIEDFLGLPFIDQGRHEEAKDRINLLLAVTHDLGFASGRKEDREFVGRWMNQEQLLLGNLGLIQHLGEAEELSEAKWLDLALNKLPVQIGEHPHGQNFEWFTDQRVKEYIDQHKAIFERIEILSR